MQIGPASIPNQKVSANLTITVLKNQTPRETYYAASPLPHLLHRKLDSAWLLEYIGAAYPARGVPKQSGSQEKDRCTFARLGFLLSHLPSRSPCLQLPSFLATSKSTPPNLPLARGKSTPCVFRTSASPRRSAPQPSFPRASKCMTSSSSPAGRSSSRKTIRARSPAPSGSAASSPTNSSNLACLRSIPKRAIPICVGSSINIPKTDSK